MAHSYHHAVSSTRRFGGEVEDYLPLHSWFDSSKSAWADQRHRAVLHTSFGIFLAEDRFGLEEENRQLHKAINRIPRWLQRLFGIKVPTHRPVTITNSAGKQVPIRLLAEQHVIEDAGFIPTLEDYLGELPRKPWMYRGAMPLSKILEKAEGVVPDLPPARESSAADLTNRVMVTMQAPPTTDALPPIQGALDAMMDDGLRTIGEKNAQYFRQSDA